MSMWQSTYTSPIVGSLFVLPCQAAERADEKRGHNPVSGDR